jgi:hypothetical protein
MAATAMLNEVLAHLPKTLTFREYHALRAVAEQHLAICEGCGVEDGTRQVRDLFTYERLRWLCLDCYAAYGKAFDALRAEECFPDGVAS